MNIYELIGETSMSSFKHHLDSLHYAFNQTNRDKLQDEYDLKVFDLLKKAYAITIIYKSDKRDSETRLEYRKYCEEDIIPYEEEELRILNSLNWNRLPHILKAHVYDFIWLINKKHEAAKIASEEYYELYHEWFDQDEWVQCVDYIQRAIELAAKIGLNEKKQEYLDEVYNDVIRLNGDDQLFLSISLIELLIEQKYSTDYKNIIPCVDRLIAKNKTNIGKSNILEQAYQVKATLYKKLKDYSSEQNVYIQYADFLIQRCEKYIDSSKGDNCQNLFLLESDIKKSIGLFQNHGAPEKAAYAQKLLVEFQKKIITHMPMQEFKYDVSEFYKNFYDQYASHDANELIWDAIFAFGFQNKRQIREDVVSNSSPITSLFPMQIIGMDGQTEFLLPGLDLSDETNVMLHMFRKAREYEMIQGQTVGLWFIQYFRKRDLKESDLDIIFDDNPIIPKGQEKDVQRGVYYGLTGHMSDALDKLAPKMENIVRNLAEICGDCMTYYDAKDGVQKKKVLSCVFASKELNECIDENVIFTFDGLLQQKAGSNIRNKVGHGLNTEAQCSTGDCIYFVMIVLKFCALYCKSFGEEAKRRTSSKAKQ